MTILTLSSISYTGPEPIFSTQIMHKCDNLEKTQITNKINYILIHAQKVITYLHIQFLRTPLVIGEKTGIISLLTYLRDRIVSFLFIALCLFASFNDLFFRLHHYGIAILVTPLTVPYTIFWLVISPLVVWVQLLCHFCKLFSSSCLSTALLGILV